MTNSRDPLDKPYSIDFVQLEEAVAAGRVSLDEIMDNFPGIIYLSNKYDLSLLKINRNGMQILGLTDDQLESLSKASFEGVVHPDHVEFVQRMASLKAEQRRPGAAHLLLHVGPGGVDPLSKHVRASV